MRNKDAPGNKRARAAFRSFFSKDQCLKSNAQYVDVFRQLVEGAPFEVALGDLCATDPMIPLLLSYDRERQVGYWYKEILQCLDLNLMLCSMETGAPIFANDSCKRTARQMEPVSAASPEAIAQILHPHFPPLTDDLRGGAIRTRQHFHRIIVDVGRHPLEANMIHLRGEGEQFLGVLIKWSVLSASQRKGLQLRDCAAAFDPGTGRVEQSMEALRCDMVRSIKQCRQALGWGERAQKDFFDLARQVKQFGEILEAAQSKADQCAHSSQEAVGRSNQLSVQIQDLAKHAEDVVRAVDLIGAIADQINLLSLNTSIECSRGDDAGRGLAVIATQVSALARRTAQASDEIKCLSACLKSLCGETISTTNESQRDLTTIRDQCRDLADALGRQVASLSGVDEKCSGGLEQMTALLGALAQMGGEASGLVKAHESVRREIAEMGATVTAISKDFPKCRNGTKAA